MKGQIIVTDLDAALAQPWSTTTCLVAQFVKRVSGETVLGCGASGAFNERMHIRFDTSVADLIFLFDNGHARSQTQALIELRTLLPREVIFDITPFTTP